MINKIHARPQSSSYRKNIQFGSLKTVDNQQAQKCFKIGKQHQIRNQIDKAQKFYLEATIHNPNFFKAYCNLGTCLRLKQKYEQAIIAYKKAKKLQNKDPITNYNLANVYRVIGSQQNAIQLYKFVIKLHQQQKIDIGKLYPDSYTNLGICYKKLGKFNQAIQCFDFIRKSYPNDKQITFNYAVCYMQLLKSLCKNRSLYKLQRLIQQISQKTKKLLTQMIQKDSKNQIVLLSLIQIQYLVEQKKEQFQVAKEKLLSIIHDSSSSSYLKEQATKLKKVCEDNLSKFQKPKQKVLPQTKKPQIRNIQKNIIKENDRSSKIQQKGVVQNNSKQRVVKENPTTTVSLNNKQKQNNDKKANDNQNKPQGQNQKMKQKAKNAQIELKKVYDQNIHKVMELISKSANYNLQASQIQKQCFKIVQNIQQNQILNFKLIDRIRKQIMIVVYSMLAEQLMDSAFLNKGFQIYINYFMQGNIEKNVNKDMLYLDSHRAIAYILTNLGYSKKAIEHFQIINNEYDHNNQNAKQVQQIHLGMAVNYQSQGLYDKAIIEYQKALSLKSNNFIFLYNLGNCHQLAGNYQEAINNYSKFLQNIKSTASQDLDQQTQLKYIYMVQINIFLCFDGDLNSSIQKFYKIQAQIENDFNNVVSQTLHIIQSQLLMNFYLKACDLLQHIIQKIIVEENKENLSKIKQRKQKILILYAKLLEFRQCPDRDIILINCGNLLYQQKQFLKALDFYKKVNQQNHPAVYNNISLTYFNINQVSKAIECMGKVIQKDPQNCIYLFNYQLFLWVVGSEDLNEQNNQFYKRYNCKCKNEYSNRLQFSKSLICKFINYIQKQTFNQKHNGSNNLIQHRTLTEFIEQMVGKTQNQNYWKDQQDFIKHKYLKAHIENHCKSAQNHKDVKQISKTQIQQLISICNRTVQNQNELKTVFNDLIQKLKKLTVYDNYKQLAQQLIKLFLFINQHKIAQKQDLLNILGSLFTQIPVVQLQFKDKVFNEQIKYPSKLFKIVYPSIQLKFQNIVQTLMTWSIQLQQKSVYLYKIIDTIAYQTKISSPIHVEYLFPTSKIIYEQQKDVVKVLQYFSSLFNFGNQQSQLKQLVLNPDQNLGQIQQQLVNQYTNNLSIFLQQKVTQTLNDSAVEQNILQMRLSNNALPIQLNIQFQTFQRFKQFMRVICKQLQIKQMEIKDNKSGQVYVVMNKLIRMRCIWGKSSFMDEILDEIRSSRLNLLNSLVVSIKEVCFDWNEAQTHNNR